MMNVAPTLAHCVWLAAPRVGAFCLGAARRQNNMWPPRSPTACGSLPPEWARFALGRPGGKTTLALRDK